MIRLATFNLFWFPSSTVPDYTRTPDAIARTAAVVARLDADVIAFEEMLDRVALRDMLALVPGRSYELVDAESETSTNMRVIVAWDSSRLELIASENVPATELENMKLRNAVALHLREQGPGLPPFWVIGAHFPSDLPGAGGSPSDRRRIACDDIARWVADSQVGQAPVFVLGDFNLVSTNPAFTPFAEIDPPLGRIPHRVLDAPPEHGGAVVSDSEQWSTLLDGVVIDHAFANPAARAWLKGDAVVYAFDLDPFFAEPRGEDGSTFFQTMSGIELIPIKGHPKQQVIGMYNVSDHRPVRIEIEPQ